ncbi:MAG: SDR family oxidoreductase [Proteobacteria bacterium]|nr:SDR family oxidoreductase [Pseudomonadota bacterium]
MVTGAAGLLGSQICRALASNGASVTLLDINRAGAENLKVDLEQLGGKSSLALTTDILNPGEIVTMLNHAEENFGTIDVLIHAMYPRTADWHLKMEEIPLESWQMNVDMHLNGTFALCQQLGARMAKKGNGTIVLFSSIYGLVGPDFSIYCGNETMTMPAAYAVIKGGISNFVRYLASYWGKSGVRVNAICPGGIFDNQPANFVQNYSAKVPMGRMGNVHDIIGPVLFLASDSSSYVTGINLPVDGGWMAI